MSYAIYTDGAVSGNGKTNAKGGWAYLVLHKETGAMIDCSSGGELNTTNQRMELLACISGCEAIKRFDPNGKVEIFSDSAYLINCRKAAWWKTWVRNGWKNSKKQPVANQDLWERLIPYFKDTEHFTFTKVKGHAGDRYNEQVDGMAVRAREAM